MRTLRILIVEDSPLDAELTLAALNDSGLVYDFVRVDTEQDFREALLTAPDVILSDYMLPAFSGMDALRLAREKFADVPFIFVSGALGEELAIESLKSGATDYVIKHRLARLGPAVDRAVREAVERRERARVEEILRQSEERFRFLAIAVPGVVFTNSADGQLQYVNPAWTEYTGQPIPEALGTGWTLRIDPHDLPAVNHWRSECVRTGVGKQIEYRVLSADNRPRWILVRVVPMTNQDGTVVQWFGTATDIDAQKQAESNHRRLVAQLDAIIGSMNEGLIVADPTGNVLSMNWAARKLFELEKTENFRQAVRDLPLTFSLSMLDGTPLHHDQWPLARVLSGETFSDFEVRVQQGNNGRQWVASYAGAPIRNTAGQVEMVVVTFRDITAQKNFQADLAAAKVQAEDANRMKDQFLATLSHELRTPLNAILGWTQLLLMDPSDQEELIGGLHTIERNAQSQTQLVEDLLDVSRIISGKLLLNIRPTNFFTVATAAVDAARPAADAKKVLLVVESPSDQLPMSGDPARLQQVVSNLLTNAIKFTPAGGTVTIYLESFDSRVRLRVRDSGQGIPAEFLPHVFERFRQADGSSSRKHGGLGLGLSIVRFIVDGHGGTVTAASDGIGHGATFTVELPVENADEGAHAIVPEIKSRMPVDGRLRGVRVLVVEDEPDARSFVAATLTKQHAEVTAVGSVSEAMEQFRRSIPDVVVSDLAMPGEDGFSLIYRIRQLSPEAGGTVRAAALTAYARPEDRAKTLDSGFQAHITKPVNTTDLINVVADLAGRTVINT